jgi:hypothetical protein
MGSLPLGMFVEGSVAILLILTIGYCFVLNKRLIALHSDRDALKQMVSDLVQATRLANSAIKGLKETAVEADLILTTRLDEAERFGVELANHVNAGQALMARIERLTSAGRTGSGLGKPAAAAALEEPGVSVRGALDQLATRPRIRGNAA